MKTGKAAGPSEISLELTAASEEEGIQVMAEIRQTDQDGLGMPVKWTLSIVVPIFMYYLCITVCSQMSLYAVVLKTPLRITHLNFFYKWSGQLK